MGSPLPPPPPSPGIGTEPNTSLFTVLISRKEIVFSGLNLSFVLDGCGGRARVILRLKKNVLIAALLEAVQMRVYCFPSGT